MFVRKNKGTGQVGKVTKLSKQKNKIKKVTILDSSNLEEVEVDAKDVVPINSHNEFIRDSRTDKWYQLSARKPGEAELRKIFEEEGKQRTPRSRSEKRRARGMCNSHAIIHM